MKINKVSYTFKVFKNGQLIQRYDSSSLRRFRNHVGTIKFQNNFEVYLKANYGNGYYNDGIYTNYKDFLLALYAFADPAIPKYLYE